MYMSKPLREELIEWCYLNIIHRCENKLTSILREHFNWIGMGKLIKAWYTELFVGQRKYGSIRFSENIQYMDPWEVVHADMIGS